jgi:CheY-like chemotaxis protein
LPKILVADDNSNIQKMVTLALKSEGIDVVAVGNGEAAVKKAIDINPDLVLADIFMPVKSGYEVCEFLKQDKRFSHVPVVLLAGAFDPFDEREAQRVGADGVLKKPFVPPDPLVALVKELLARSSEHLVGVSIPAQAASPIQSSPSASAPVAEASAPSATAPQTFTPPAFVQSAASSMAHETVEDEIDEAVVVPVRDFVIPGAADEPENGGAIPFASMLETTSLETESPAAGTIDSSEVESGPKPAGSHSAFEGFTPWRASATSVVSEEEEPAPQPNQYMPSTKDLMGRGWEDDPALAEKSPDETIIESGAEFSSLTHSVAHTTNVREEASPVAEQKAPAEPSVVEESGEPVPAAVAPEPEPEAESRVSDWRSVFHRPPATPEQDNHNHESSMSPWEQFASKSNAAPSEETAATPLIAEPESNTESGPAVEAESVAAADSEPSSYSGTPSIDDSGATGSEQSSTADASVGNEISADASENAQPAPETSAADSHAPETSEWASALPQHLTPEDTTTIARSLVDTLAPAAVQSMATSFPVPTGALADPQVVEGIVARVVERMQPQILDIITREVLRPVVEALVRRQLEQKSPE